MATIKINIPHQLVDGFVALSTLTEEQGASLGQFLNKLPVGSKFNQVEQFINSELNVSDAARIVTVIVSFGELLEPENVNPAQLAADLVNSLQSKYADQVSAIDAKRLENNLTYILQNSKNFKLTLKAYNLVLENSNLFSGCKILTDVRLIFDDNITESNRNAVIFHKLHLTVKNSGKSQEMFITMDNGDLKKLRDSLDRALLKEDLIKEDYENIHFINYSV